MKKSFIVHTDSLDVLDDLTKDQRAEFIMALREYVREGTEPESGIIRVALRSFMNQFIRDDEKYQVIVKRNKANGSHNKPKQPTGLSGKPQYIDSDSDSVNDNEKKGPTKKHPDAKNLILRTADVFILRLALPFKSAKFKQKLNELLDQKKWKKKQLSAIDTSLERLKEYEEDFAIELVTLAVGGEYQGLTFPDTPKKYQDWKRSQKPAQQSGKMNQAYEQVRNDIDASA